MTVHFYYYGQISIFKHVHFQAKNPCFIAFQNEGKKQKAVVHSLVILFNLPLAFEIVLFVVIELY